MNSVIGIFPETSKILFWSYPVRFSGLCEEIWVIYAECCQLVISLLLLWMSILILKLSINYLQLCITLCYILECPVNQWWLSATFCNSFQCFFTIVHCFVTFIFLLWFYPTYIYSNNYWVTMCDRQVFDMKWGMFGWFWPDSLYYHWSCCSAIEMVFTACHS